MPRYGLIQDGKVVNSIECDENFAKLNNLILLPNNIGNNDLYDGVNFIKSNLIPESKIELTKEDLLIQLQILQNKINGLG